MASILVIDDDEILCRLLANCLRAAGHAAQEATKGAEALRALSRCSFDWIVCDLFMPDLDGLEVIYEVRKRWPDVKIIAMSAGGWGGRLDMLPVAKEYGALCLRKPFPIDDLLALIEGDTSARPLSCHFAHRTDTISDESGSISSMLKMTVIMDGVMEGPSSIATMK